MNEKIHNNIMKAIIQVEMETIRNSTRRPGEANLIHFGVNSRTLTIRLFGIAIFKKWESYKD